MLPTGKEVELSYLSRRPSILASYQPLRHLTITHPPILDFLSHVAQNTHSYTTIMITKMIKSFVITFKMKYVRRDKVNLFSIYQRMLRLHKFSNWVDNENKKTVLCWMRLNLMFRWCFRLFVANWFYCAKQIDHEIELFVCRVAFAWLIANSSLCRGIKNRFLSGRLYPWHLLPRCTFTLAKFVPVLSGPPRHSHSKLSIIYYRSQ